jgi:hypothetical protein
MVESIIAYSVGDTYTQAAADARFVNKNVGGLVLVGSGTATAQNRLNISNCFSSAYTNYRVEVTNLTHSTAGNLFLRFSANGTDTAGSGYATQRNETSGSTVTGVSLVGTSYISPTFVNSTANSFATFSFDVINPFATVQTSVIGMAFRVDGGSSTSTYAVPFAGWLGDTTSYDGISLVGNTGNITCTIRIYGYNNGV